MILIQYKIPKMKEKDSNVDPNYEFVLSVDNNTQNNIHNLKNLDYIGPLTGKDYNFIRDEIFKEIVSRGGFDNLSNTTEKIIAAKWICCTEAQALTVISQQEYDKYAGNLVDEAYNSRENRRLLAKKVLGIEVVKGTLDYNGSNQMDKDSGELARAWVNARNSGFIDWIMNSGSYSGSGFEVQPYGTLTRKQVLIDYIISGSIK